MWAALGLIVVFIVKNTYLAFLAYVQARYNSGRRVSISNRLFRAYLRSPYTFHLQRNTAELLRNTNGESGTIIGGVMMPVMSIVMEALVLAFVFVLLFVVEPRRHARRVRRHGHHHRRVLPGHADEDRASTRRSSSATGSSPSRP